MSDMTNEKICDLYKQ